MCIWDNNVNVLIKSMNKNIISAYISDHYNKFWISCVYGHPELQHRQQVWNQLTQFAQSLNQDDEWVTMGDFNQVL